ncbi:potassium/proton antiporter [Fodinicurvata sp. EGI_FJ10296]|uniref:potassium/proton antiporter n=1 Tax=Fodinicurvata sp. EGI_FJ10296 TaxID=3231908 RepID=UPI003454A286
MLDPYSITILAAAGLTILSVLTSLISFRVGTPLLLIFLLIGLAAGEDGIGGIDFHNPSAAYFIGNVALAVILFDSGFGTRLTTLRLAAGPAVVLATVGVLLTAALVALPAHFLLGFDVMEALLLGAIISSTDAAAVFFLLRIGGIQIRERVRATLEVESGSNDPMAIFLTIALVEAITAGHTNLAALSGDLITAFVMQMGLGALAGLAGGFLISSTLNALRLEAGLTPIIVHAASLAVFAVTALSGGSGFLAVYVAGLVVGNRRTIGMLSLRRFQDGLTWLAQITMFLMLGLLATPSEFPTIMLPAVVIAVFLTLFARPAVVALCLAPFGYSIREIGFIAWVGLRGAVSILLAILPVLGGLEMGQDLFNMAFLMVLTSLLIQGWTIGPMARRLRLTVPPRIGPVDKVELELPGSANHELVVYRLAPNCPVARGQRLPRWARPSLIVRDGRSMRLHDAGRVRAGDFVYIFAVPRMIPLLDRLFATPAALDDDDLEFFGQFSLDPKRPLGDIARIYDLNVSDDVGALSLRDYLRRKLGAVPTRGDRLTLGAVDLIVQETGEDGDIEKVGLALVPDRPEPVSPLKRVRRWIRRQIAAPAARKADR